MSRPHPLLVQTPDANLAKGMRQLNGVYTQRFNRTHERVGHVFQGRYKAILSVITVIEGAVFKETEGARSRRPFYGPASVLA